VIGHEIAHVTAKHIHEKLSQELAVNTVGTVGMILAPASWRIASHGRPLEQRLWLTTSVGGFAV